MNLDGWLRQRRPVWKRLETIVDQLVRRGPRRTPARQVADLVELYQSACADLARLRAIGAEPDLVDPLNRLIIRAHGQVYRGAPASPWSLGAFFFSDYPRLFRRTWKFTLASFLISLITACAAFWTVQDSPQTVADIMGGSDREFYGEKSLADIRERFGHEGNPMFSSLVITNNIRVALMAFALGISFGLGTIWVLAVNGAMLGGIAGGVCQERHPGANVDGDPAARRAGVKRDRDCRRRRADRGLRPLGAGAANAPAGAPRGRHPRHAVGRRPGSRLRARRPDRRPGYPQRRRWRRIQGHLGDRRRGDLLALSVRGRGGEK